MQDAEKEDSSCLGFSLSIQGRCSTERAVSNGWQTTVLSAYLCSFRLEASQTRTMASPPALHRWLAHMASACTVLQWASAGLLVTSGTPFWARLPSGRTGPLPEVRSA